MSCTYVMSRRPLRVEFKMATADDPSVLGAESEIQYPLHVEYCGVCTMPPEYCEYGPDPAKCYEWMKVHLPDDYSRLVENVADQLEDLSTGDSKRQTRGGKALRKQKKKEEVVKHIQVSRAQRSKKKYVTVVVGLKTFDIDLKRASKTFAQHFSCGSSVTGDDEVVIQGDVGTDVLDFIQERWSEVDDKCIEFIGDQKR